MKTMVERVLKSSHLPGLARTRQVPIMALCALLWTMTVSAQDGEAFFASDVSPHVEPCFACHLNGGVADNSGARLVFRDGADSFNYNAMADFYAHSDVDQGLILAKISGGAGIYHFPPGSATTFISPLQEPKCWFRLDPEVSDKALMTNQQQSVKTSR